MTECAANRHAEFTRDLFSQPVSQHRGISFKFRDEMHALVATLNRCEIYGRYRKDIGEMQGR